MSSHLDLNKAGYTAQDAPSTRLKITRDGRTDERTDGRTDTSSCRDATAHLKRGGGGDQKVAEALGRNESQRTQAGKRFHRHPPD